MTSKPRLCTLCGRSRGTNPDCAKCARRRRAGRNRVARDRAGWKRKGLCAGGCGDKSDPGYDTCSVCRGKGRQRRRSHRLKALPY
jgi:hypothetical protein